MPENEICSCLCFIGLSILAAVPFLVIIFHGQNQITDLTTKQIRLLHQVDKCETLESLIMTVEQVLNEDVRDQMPIESSNIRAVIWNEVPSGEIIETYFDKNLRTIKYDKTYQDLKKKDFDYTGQHTLLSGRYWEKIIFIRIEKKFITLFFSYTMQSYAASTSSNHIEKFFSEVLKRMYNKLSNPTKILDSHRFPSLEDQHKAVYFLIKYDSLEGYTQKMIPSIDDGLKEQEEIDDRKQSSCILKIQGGQKSLLSIRYSMYPDSTIPDFHAYYEIKYNFKNKQSTAHNDF